MEIIKERVLQLVAKIAEEARFINTEQQSKEMSDEVRQWVVAVCDGISQDFANQATELITKWSVCVERDELVQAKEQRVALFQLLDLGRSMIGHLVQPVERLNASYPEIYGSLVHLLHCIFADILVYMHEIRQTIALALSSEGVINE